MKWTSGRGSDSIAILTSMSIQAVGKSDRSDSRALLEELRSKPVTQDPRSLGFNRNLAGAVVSGLFSCDMLDQEGLVGARALFADPERSWKRYLEWAESESGKRLTRWCDEVSIRPRAAPDGDYK